MAKFNKELRNQYQDAVRQALGVAEFAKRHAGLHSSAASRREKVLRERVAKRLQKTRGVDVKVNGNGQFVMDTRGRR